MEDRRQSHYMEYRRKKRSSLRQVKIFASGRGIGSFIRAREDVESKTRY